MFGGLPLERFEAKYADDVGEPEEEVCLEVRETKEGVLFVLRGGLVVVEDGKGKWSLYETKLRVEEREYYRQWNEFIRGCWLDKVPSCEGVFPVRDREGNRGHDRTLRRVNGRLVDVTRAGGFVEAGRVTRWAGEWWSLPMPPLRGAI